MSKKRAIGRQKKKKPNYRLLGAGAAAVLMVGAVLAGTLGAPAGTQLSRQMPGSIAPRDGAGIRREVQFSPSQANGLAQRERAYSVSQPKPVVAPKLTAAEARKEVEEGRAVLLDVRGAAEASAERIGGALAIPLNQLAARRAELPKGKTIITYCACPNEESSNAAAGQLMGAGFSASALSGGIEGWRRAGYPMTSGGGN